MIAIPAIAGLGRTGPRQHGGPIGSRLTGQTNRTTLADSRRPHHPAGVNNRAIRQADQQVALGADDC